MVETSEILEETKKQNKTTCLDTFFCFFRKDRESQRTLDLPGGLGSQGRGYRGLNASLEANLGERITAEQAWDRAQPSSSKTLGASIQEGLQMYHLKSKPKQHKRHAL